MTAHKCQKYTKNKNKSEKKNTERKYKHKFSLAYFEELRITVTKGVKTRGRSCESDHPTLRKRHTFDQTFLQRQEKKERKKKKRHKKYIH